jgi:hypothetical protein
VVLVEAVMAITPLLEVLLLLLVSTTRAAAEEAAVPQADLVLLSFVTHLT